MNSIKRLLAVAAVSALLTACGGQGNPPGVIPQNPGAPGYAKLQLAVGALTVAGPTGVVIGTGVNMVSTLRQPNGRTAVLVDTPTFTGPFTLSANFPGNNAGAGGSTFAVEGFSTVPAPVNMGASTTPSGVYTGGPSLADVGANALTGTSQNVRPGTPACDTAGSAPAGYTPCSAGVSPDTTTFGQSGGVFGMGLQPANAFNSGVPLTSIPYSVPLFAACTTGPLACASAQSAGVAYAGTPATTATNQMLPWGGPPAFDPDNDHMGTRDGQFFVSQFQGVFEGITAFQFTQPLAALTGAYTLNVQIPTGLNNQGQSGFATVSQTATLTSAAGLPALATPAFTTDGSGGGTITLPAADFTGGISEIYIEIVDLGPAGALGTKNCQGQYGTVLKPVYYTIAAHSTDASFTYPLPDANGPNINQSSATAQTPSPSICTGAQNTTALGAPTAGDAYSVQLIGMDYPLYEASYPKNLQQTPTISGPSGQSDLTLSYPMTQNSP